MYTIDRHCHRQPPKNGLSGSYPQPSTDFCALNARLSVITSDNRANVSQERDTAAVARDGLRNQVPAASGARVRVGRRSRSLFSRGLASCTPLEPRTHLDP